jgi:hypothetical protein
LLPSSPDTPLESYPVAQTFGTFLGIIENIRETVTTGPAGIINW